MRRLRRHFLHNRCCRIDGWQFNIYARIVLPPATALSAWDLHLHGRRDDLQLLVLDDLPKRTLPFRLALFRQQFGMMGWNVIMGPFCLYRSWCLLLGTKKSFIEGMALSGIKG